VRKAEGRYACRETRSLSCLSVRLLSLFLFLRAFNEQASDSRWFADASFYVSRGTRFWANLEPQLEAQFRWNSPPRTNRVRERILFPRGCARALNRGPIYAEYGEKSVRDFLAGRFHSPTSEFSAFGCIITNRPARNRPRPPATRRIIGNNVESQECTIWVLF